MTRIGDAAEWGAKGYAVTVARYGEHQMQQWRKRGGRKRNPTLADLQAVSGPAKKRVTNRAAGSTPAATTTGEMPR